MKKIALAVLLLCSVFAWAELPNPAEYSIKVHVRSSRLHEHSQRLNVIIGGKKYELTSDSPFASILALGDYMAKLVKDEHKSAYDSYQTYEFLFPDQQTRKFTVVGQTE